MNFTIEEGLAVELALAKAPEEYLQQLRDKGEGEGFLCGDEPLVESPLDLIDAAEETIIATDEMLVLNGEGVWTLGEETTVSPEAVFGGQEPSEELTLVPDDLEDGDYMLFAHFNTVNVSADFEAEGDADASLLTADILDVQVDERLGDVQSRLKSFKSIRAADQEIVGEDTDFENDYDAYEVIFFSKRSGGLNVIYRYSGRYSEDEEVYLGSAS